MIDGEGDASIESVEEGEGVSEPDVVAVGEDVGVQVPLALVVAVALAESETLGVSDALAPIVTDAVWEDDSEAAADSLADGVPTGVCVDVAVGLLVPVTLALDEGDSEAELESEPVADALAPIVSEAVGVRETERDIVQVELGESDGVGVPLDVALAVGVLLRVSEIDALGVPETLGVYDALAP